MQVQSGLRTAQMAQENFRQAFDLLADDLKKEPTPKGLLRLADRVNIALNEGLVLRGVLLREGDSAKFPYTKVEHLAIARKQFAEEFVERLRSGDPIETAAWVHWRVNFTDHFYADGVGRTSDLLAAYVHMRHKIPLPKDVPRAEWFAQVETRSPVDPRAGGAAYTGDAYKKWLDYYRSLVPQRKWDRVFKHLRRVSKHYGPGRHPGTGTQQTSHDPTKIGQSQRVRPGGPSGAGITRLSTQRGRVFTDAEVVERLNQLNREHANELAAGRVGRSSSQMWDKVRRSHLELLEEQGFTSRPMVRNPKAFELIWEESAPERRLWRGVGRKYQGEDRPSGEEIADQLRRGQYYLSSGIHGHGIYAASGEGAEKVAWVFAGEGTVVRMVLHPKAKVISRGEIWDLANEIEPILERPNFISVPEQLSLVAIAKGYDAIYLPATDRAMGFMPRDEGGVGDQWLILNRGALIVESRDQERPQAVKGASILEAQVVLSQRVGQALGRSPLSRTQWLELVRAVNRATSVSDLPREWLDWLAQAESTRKWDRVFKHLGGVGGQERHPGTQTEQEVHGRRGLAQPALPGIRVPRSVDDYEELLHKKLGSRVGGTRVGLTGLTTKEAKRVHDTFVEINKKYPKTLAWLSGISTTEDPGVPDQQGREVERQNANAATGLSVVLGGDQFPTGVRMDIILNAKKIREDDKEGSYSGMAWEYSIWHETGHMLSHRLELSELTAQAIKLDGAPFSVQEINAMWRDRNKIFGKQVWMHSHTRVDNVASDGEIRRIFLKERENAKKRALENGLPANSGRYFRPTAYGGTVPQEFLAEVFAITNTGRDEQLPEGAREIVSTYMERAEKARSGPLLQFKKPKAQRGGMTKKEEVGYEPYWIIDDFVEPETLPEVRPLSFPVGGFKKKWDRVFHG